MSESESESESDVDFSASEDEFIPTGEESDPDSSDDDEESVDDTSVISDPKKPSKSPQKRDPRRTNEDDDDSDSSVENYLVNPNEIDLASDFFNPNVKTVVPSFDCNVGLNLSDSDEEEILSDVPSSSRDVAKLLDFNAHEEFNKNLESAKDHLRKFKSSNFGQDNCDDVTKLLAIGESSSAISPSKVKRRKEVMSTDESDFEEVEGVVKTDNRKDVEVRIGPAIKQKLDKHQAEIEASIKRRINRRKKENQLMMHKVHLLSWIAYGNFVNKVLNSTKLMQMVVKYIPSEKCYPKEQTDQKYFEQIIKWYLQTVGLKNKEQNCSLKCLPPLPTSLALQIQSKMAICKKDYLFIFIILLRSIGIQCRLVINLATVPIRPPAKDLCVISLKNSGDETKKVTKSTKKKKSSAGKREEKNVKGKDSKSKGDKLKRGISVTGVTTKSPIARISITGEVSKISTETSEPSNHKKSLKSKLQAAVKSTEKDENKKKLKRRSVSVNETSTVNAKQSRSTSNGPTSSKVSKIDSKKTGTEPNRNDANQKISKRRSLSLHSPMSVNRTGKQSSNQSAKVAKNVAKGSGVTTKSPIARRTRQASLSVPQLDGGNDTKTKKEKPQLSKLKSLRRSRSASPTSSKRSQSETKETGGKDDKANKKSKPNLMKIRLPSRSRSVSKSPTSSKSLATKSTEGNDENGKKAKPKPKPNLFRIRLPSRSRSVSKSPTSLRTSILATDLSSENSSPEKVLSGKASAEKTTTSQRTSRRQKFEDSMSKGLSTSSVKSSKDSKEATRSTATSEPRTKKEKPLSSKSVTLTKSVSPMTSPVKSTAVSNSVKGLSSKETIQSSSSTSKGRSSSKATVRSSSKETVSSSKGTIPSSKATVSSSSKGTRSSKVIVPPTSKGTVSSTSKPTASPTKPASSSSSKCNPQTKLSKATSSAKEISTKGLKHKASENISSDSDFAPSPKKKLNASPGVEKPLPKAVEKLKKIDRRVLSTDDESIQPAVKKNDMNYWVEVYCEADSKWMCIDLFKLKVNSVDEVKKHATKPIAYVFGWNNNNSIRDVSPRYCSQWNTTTRKLRVPPEWLNEALSHYKEPISQRCVAEDRELEEIHSKVPIPTSISELKNHPLYVLPRHLLKFEGIYPPNPIPVGYIRDEPIYSRLCVHTLHSREIWVKQARTVKPGEIPYKIVKARPKWDRLANKMLECQPLEIFGFWQTQPYEPPVAENGIVPRNPYGNVELFKPEMLPKNTVHLRLPGLNRVCAKLKIDCAQAVVGFDFHGGSSHPTFDGFVVCEEFQELVTMRWWEEQAEAEQKSKEKQMKRVYDNWKKLIKGLLIRERLQRKYNFAGKDAAAASSSKKE